MKFFSAAEHADFSPFADKNMRPEGKAFGAQNFKNACVSSSRKNAALFYGSPYTINARAGGHSFSKRYFETGL